MNFQARRKMEKVDDLRNAWEQDLAASKAASEKKSKKNKVAPDADDIFIDDDAGQEGAPSSANLFEDSDSDDDNDETGEGNAKGAVEKPAEDETDAVGDPGEAAPTQEDLFGESSDEESDEELAPSNAKRSNDDDKEEQQPAKKRKVVEEED
jgi:hypothetical protein